MNGWRPSLGANFLGWGTAFRIWAPDVQKLDLVLQAEDAGERALPMARGRDGYFYQVDPDARPGDLYWYRVDGRGPFPDPASRFQPRGVHGPSEIVDPWRFGWTDRSWRGIPLEEVVLYELHVGTFTPAGDFPSATAKLPYLKDLGVTAVELMPVADFAGSRNWGYDGVALFAPARCYGRPEDLQRLVDEAHRLGLAVFLDVVYNHFGPDGAYHTQFSKAYYSQSHRSPWGDGINFDGPGSEPVRDFFIENALRWVHEYHIDGLRLDATHAIVDDSPRCILADIAAAVRRSLENTGRTVHAVAEDVRNLDYMLRPERDGGWELDGVWSDDFHHQMRRALAGDSDGYFQDFDGSAWSIAETAQKGWYYCGQFAPYFQQPRGTDPTGIALQRFVFFIQNHDQVGNRAFGDRLHHAIDLAAYRAATALLLLLPETPLLFMGQEWAASSPFRFFTDHCPELGKLVTEGRRSEFSRFAAFADPETRAKIPDPQDPRTFEASRLVWEEAGGEPHASTLRLYRELLRVRREYLKPDDGFTIRALNESAVTVRRGAVSAVIWLRGAGKAAWDDGGRELILSTEAAEYACDSKAPAIDPASGIVTFARPGALIFHMRSGL